MVDYDYPNPAEDPEFQSKLYKKREFYANRIVPRLKPMTEKEVEQYRAQVCSDKPQIQSHQAFLSQFISPETPYMGVLVYHGTGSGKTFASISICEGFKEQVLRYRTKMYIVVPGPILKEQFKRDLVTVCTNRAYMTAEHAAAYDNMSESDKAKARELAYRSALRFYTILSYKSFHRRVLGEKRGSGVHYGSHRIESLNNSVIVVDEAHNIIGNQYGEALNHLRKVSSNLRIVLLTATPMKNLANEVVPLLNFVRPLEDPIEMSRVFVGTDFDLTFAEGGESYLRRMATGYVSFYRGNNPFTFARRNDQGVIPPFLLFTPVIRCEMSPFQLETYARVADKYEHDALDKHSEAAANFIFPVMDMASGRLGGAHGMQGLRTVQQQVPAGRLSKLVTDEFFGDSQQEADPNQVLFIDKETKRPTGRFLQLPYLAHFSTKFAVCLKNLLKLQAGTAFVYSNLVQIGTNLFRDVLVANGFVEYNPHRNYKLLPSTLSYDMKQTYAEHIKSQSKTPFFPAIFLMVTGGDSSDVVPASNIEVIQKVFNTADNVLGAHLKLILGSRVVNEGVTLENVREVHILDVHYHLGRVDQVIGRAIRQCRHMMITEKGKPSPDVRVYRYVASFPESDGRYSREEVMYHRAEVKFVTIKSTERILQEVAVDCPVNFAANQVLETLIEHKDCRSVDEVMSDPSLKQALCPAQCGFRDCRYKCGDHTLNLSYYDRTRHIYKNIMKSHLDYSTFSLTNAKLEVDFCKAVVKDLYRLQDALSIEQLNTLVQTYYSEDKVDLFDELFLLKALTQLMPVGDSAILNFTDFVVDRFNMKGYLVYERGLYVFKPLTKSRDGVTREKHSLDQYLRKTNQKVKFEYDRERYADKPENFIVGIIDQTRDGKEVFKIRPPRDKQTSKKRASGLPTEKGSVCHFSRTIKELRSILKRLGGDGQGLSSRKEICEEIRTRLLKLQKQEGKHKTYVILPKHYQTRET